MSTTDGARASRWEHVLSWAGGGAAAGGIVTVACGACAALPLATVAIVAGGLAVVGAGLGFLVAGGLALVGAVAARQRHRRLANTDCCGPDVRKDTV